MATPVIMPRQGQSVESCVIGMWHKKLGDKVSVGEDLFTYETDKAAFDESAKVAGEILAIFFKEGDDVPCLTTVCVIGEAGEDHRALIPEGAGGEGAVASPASAEPAPVAEVVQAVPPLAVAPAAAMPAAATPAGISPRARAVAEKHAVDLRQVEATGPKGRVIERDIFKLIDEGKFATGAAGSDFAVGTVGSGIGGRVSVADLATVATTAVAPAAAPLVESRNEKHSNIRKLIAKSMVTSLSTMAQLTYNMSFDATDLLAFRARVKKAKEAGLTGKLGLPDSITINDIILYVV